MIQKMTGVGAFGNKTGSPGSWAVYSQKTCRVEDSSINSTEAGEGQCNAEEEAASGSLVLQIGWILFGQVLCGLGSCAQPLCITYLDDNVKNRRTTTIFVGIIFSTFSLGPTMGFLLATYCLAKPTYFHDPSYPVPTISQEHPYYIGAWWLGYLINGILLLVVCVPFFFFPKSMRKNPAQASGGGATYRMLAGLQDSTAETKRDGYTDDRNSVPRETQEQHDQGFLGFFKGFFASVKRTLTNLTAMSVYLATCVAMMGNVGWFVFGPKYLYSQYRLPPAKSAMLFGLVMLPGPILGNFFSSLIVHKLRLSSAGCAKMVLFLSVFGLLSSPTIFWMGCDNPLNVGLTTPYPNVEDRVQNTSSLLPTTAAISNEGYNDLISSCNADCDCAPDFVPVCGSDGLTYATACHAGCKETRTVDTGGTNTTIFAECSCIPPTAGNSTLVIGVDAGDSGFAVPGECSWSCSKVYYLLGIMPLLSLLGAMTYNPAFMLQFRSHREEDRSTALGVNNVLMKVLALIPAPICFGALLEKTSCLFFQQSCGKSGNCLVYDVVAMRLLFTLFGTCTGVVAYCLFIVALLSVRKKKEGK